MPHPRSQFLRHFLRILNLRMFHSDTCLLRNCVKPHFAITIRNTFFLSYDSSFIRTPLTVVSPTLSISRTVYWMSISIKK